MILLSDCDGLITCSRSGFGRVASSLSSSIHQRIYRVTHSPAIHFNLTTRSCNQFQYFPQFSISNGCFFEKHSVVQQVINENEYVPITRVLLMLLTYYSSLMEIILQISLNHVCYSIKRIQLLCATTYWCIRKCLCHYSRLKHIGSLVYSSCFHNSSLSTINNQFIQLLHCICLYNTSQYLISVFY